MPKFMKVFNHGDGSIDLTSHKTFLPELTPTEIHYKNNGSIDDKPSFAIVMESNSSMKVYGQFSLETLKECLNELGFSILQKGKEST